MLFSECQRCTAVLVEVARKATVRLEGLKLIKSCEPEAKVGGLH